MTSNSLHKADSNVFSCSLPLLHSSLTTEHQIINGFIHNLSCTVLSCIFKAKKCQLSHFQQTPNSRRLTGVKSRALQCHDTNGGWHQKMKNTTHLAGRASRIWKGEAVSIYCSFLTRMLLTNDKYRLLFFIYLHKQGFSILFSLLIIQEATEI